MELTLWSKDTYLRVGNEVGWVGFPSVAPDKLCFFSGRVSCYLDDKFAYLVDGVAISGVSGGPAFFPMGTYAPIVGFISSYIPTLAKGINLPGVSVVRDVKTLHEWVGQFKNLEEAKKAASPPSGFV